MNMKRIIAATTLRALLSYLFSKNSGIVAACRWFVITLVLLPRITHAISEPMRALPRPIQGADIPKFQPNWPAYPTNTTEEKYEVPKAKAVSHGPTCLQPKTN